MKATKVAIAAIFAGPAGALSMTIIEERSEAQQTFLTLAVAR
jgi:hypothetical protein